MRNTFNDIVMKRILYIIWLLLLFSQIILFVGVTGIVDFLPPSEKYYYCMNEESLQIAKERLEDAGESHKYEENAVSQQSVKEHGDSIIEYERWPIGNAVFMDVVINENMRKIELSAYYFGKIEINTVGVINRFDRDGSSFINQIKAIDLFEKSIMHDLPYCSDTSIIQDCTNYLIRPFMELSVCLFVPFLLLTLLMPFIVLYDKKQKEDNECSEYKHTSI